jgi:hypothetical protein
VKKRPSVLPRSSAFVGRAAHRQPGIRDPNDYVAYFPTETLEGSEDSEDAIFWSDHGYTNPVFWSGYTDPENQTKKTTEQMAWEKAGPLARVKNIRAASTRQDWEADGSRLWVRKGDPELRVVDLTDDEGPVELDERWARSAGAPGCPPGGALHLPRLAIVGEGPRGLRGLGQGVHTSAPRREGRPTHGRSLAVRPMQGHLGG